MQLSRWHALGQEEDNLSNRSTRSPCTKRRCGFGRALCRQALEERAAAVSRTRPRGGAADEMVRGCTAFVGREFADYLRVGESGKFMRSEWAPGNARRHVRMDARWNGTIEFKTRGHEPHGADGNHDRMLPNNFIPREIGQYQTVVTLERFVPSCRARLILV